MTTHGSSGSLWHLLLMAGWLPAALLHPEDPAVTHRPGLVPAPSTNRWAEWMGWATQPGHLSPDPCCQPPAPASGTSGHPHRQCLPKTGGWRWTDRTVGRRGAWEPPSAGPAGDRRAIQVLRDPWEGPASSLHLGPLAPLSLRTSFGRTHLSMQFVPTPPRHERPTQLPTLQPPLAHGKYQHFEKQRWGSRGPPTPRPLEAGGAAI